jgi:aryl-alcohol dehydrogenase-like predicted oxidoreductase/enamine deaminase RidA (YjgF/YER057c/UK114 family)
MPGVVERVELAPGFEIARLVLGLWQVADMERQGARLDAEHAADAMGAYVDAGLTTFDMADHYGSAEDIAGAFRARAQHGGEMLTKWVPRPGPVTRQDVRAAVERAIERLRSDRIDLLQFHAWRYADPRWLDCLFWLQELKADGLIRHLGLTNFDTAHLHIALSSGLDITSNQVCFSLIDRRPTARMLDLCRSTGVGLLAYGTVAGGLLTERWLGAPEPILDGLTWSESKYLRFIRAAGGWDAFQSLLCTLNDIARRHNTSMANVACRWVLDHPGVSAVIVGARLGETSHIDDNRRLFGLQLDDTDRARLNATADALTAIPGDCGDEYRRPPFLTATGDLSQHFDEMPLPFAPDTDGTGSARVITGTTWESVGGFSRAVRRGDRIVVSGTTATHGDRVIGGSDATAQMHFIIDKIEGAILSLGGRLEDIIRTRLYVRRIEDWEAVTRAHGQRLSHVMPANTLVQANLVGADYLVEMEAEAQVSGNA